MTVDTSAEAVERRASLVHRLRGHYRIPITDGLGPAGGEEPDNAAEFVRTFQTPPIQHEAAAEIERLTADRDAARAEAQRLREALAEIESLHTPSMPATYGGEERDWIMQHVGTLRRIARAALAGEPRA